MVRKELAKDTQLQVRMLITMTMLGLVYGILIAGLWALNLGLSFIVIVAVGMALAQFWLSDRMVLASMRAKIVTPEQEPQLHRIVERLAGTAGVAKPRVAVAQLAVPNAFASGRSAKSATISVTTGLRSLLNERELEAVLAHEMCHIKHRDVVVMTYASFFAVVASSLMSMFFWMGLFGGFHGRRGGGSNGGAILVAYVLTAVVWFLSQMLLAALSRYREFAADRGAAILTERPGDLASALTRIHGSLRRVPENDLRKAESMNAFFIMPAVGDGLANLFASHPPIAKRIEALQAIEAALTR